MGLTFLALTDGEPADYLELAEAMAEHGSSVQEDLAQLGRRVAFMIIINSVDDHLRNHGFLRTSAGWELSPAFDLNPDPDVRAARATSINSAVSAAGGLAELRACADAFRLETARVEGMWNEVLAGTEDWRSVARTNGVRAGEIDLFAAALDRFRS